MHEPQADAIHIRDLRLRCIIGVNPEERDKEQDVKIDVTMYTDLRRPGRSDDIQDTVDYQAVEQGIVQMIRESRFRLLERLAEAVAEICLQAAAVRQVKVVVEKPGALRFARTVAVQIVRDRGDQG